MLPITLQDATAWVTKYAKAGAQHAMQEAYTHCVPRSRALKCSWCMSIGQSCCSQGGPRHPQGVVHDKPGEMPEAKQKGEQNVRLPPDAAPSCAWWQVRFERPELVLPGLALRIGPRSSVELATTYLDPRVRLGRGSRGSRFVFMRGGAADLAGARPDCSAAQLVPLLMHSGMGNRWSLFCAPILPSARAFRPVRPWTIFPGTLTRRSCALA